MSININNGKILDLTLITSLEISSIEKAIELLNEELKIVIELEKELLALKGNHVRKSKKKIKKKLDTYKSQQQLVNLILDLNKEISKINKKKRTKIANLKKTVARKERKLENKKYKEGLSSIGRYELSKKLNLKAVESQLQEAQGIAEDTGYMSTLERVVDDRSNKDVMTEIEKVYLSVFDVEIEKSELKVDIVLKPTV